MEQLRILVLALGLALGVWKDFTAGKIPNKLTVPLALAGFGMSFFLEGPLASAGGFTVGALIGIGCWLLHLFRAGDAKLLMALGALMSWRWLCGCFCWSLVIGAALGLALLLGRGQLRQRMQRIWHYLKGLILLRSFQPYEPLEGTQRELPFSLPIALGAAAACFFPLF